MKDNNTERELDNPQVEKKIKKAVNDISTDLAALCTEVNSISEQLPSMLITRNEVNTFKLQIEKYDKKLEKTQEIINKGVDVRVSPVSLSESHANMLDDLGTSIEAKNKRWALLFKAVASTGKIKVVFTAFASIMLTVAVMLQLYDNSPHVWAHRAFVAAEISHLEDPAGEYSKAFINMQGKGKDRKECQKRIEGMEAEAKYIKKLERILYGYTDEEIEVREYKTRIKEEQKAMLVCYHPSTKQNVNYRIHTTPEREIVKVEREKKTQSKVVWEELKPIARE